MIKIEVKHTPEDNMLAISNDELQNAEVITEGDFAPCPLCGVLVKVKDAFSNDRKASIQFISHCDKDWFVGLNKRFLMKKHRG